MTTATLWAPPRAPKRAAMPALPWGHNFAHHKAIGVYRFLRADAALIRLQDFLQRVPPTDPNDAREMNLSRSFYVASWALEETMASELRDLIRAGHLPFCWHGTRFIEPFSQTTTNTQTTTGAAA